MHVNPDNYFLQTDISVCELIPFIDWNFFFIQWDLPGRYPAIFDHPTRGPHARELYDHAQAMLPTLDVTAAASYHILSAERMGDDILIAPCNCCPTRVRLPMLRNQTTHFKSLADYVDEQNNVVTPFALCVHNQSHFDDDYNALMSQILCDRLADALSTYITTRVEKQLMRRTLSMAFGYPAAPDHSPKRLVFDLLQAQKRLGMKLTDNYSMYPTSSVCGVMFSHPDIDYFSVGYIGEDQVVDYSSRAGLSPEQLRVLIPNNLLTSDR